MARLGNAEGKNPVTIGKNGLEREGIPGCRRFGLLCFMFHAPISVAAA